jgi:hypothetical protein
LPFLALTRGTTTKFQETGQQASLLVRQMAPSTKLPHRQAQINKHRTDPQQGTQTALAGDQGQQQAAQEMAGNNEREGVMHTGATTHAGSRSNHEAGGEQNMAVVVQQHIQGSQRFSGLCAQRYCAGLRNVFRKWCFCAVCIAHSTEPCRANPAH